MGSINAAAVADKVINIASKGKLINLQKITESCGYARASARAQNAKRTKTFQNRIKPIVIQLEKERQRAIEALKTKNLNEVVYEKLVDAIDKMTKNIELFMGNPTERREEKYDDNQIYIIAERRFRSNGGISSAK